MSGLAAQLEPCGPVLDVGLAARTREPVEVAAREDGWLKTLDAAWPALEPVFAASPYLAGLARRGPERLRAILETAPDDGLAAILEQTHALTGGADDLRAPLRALKADLHLLTALCDLGGVWDLDQVTGALTAFADAATRAALRAVAHDARQRGKLVSAAADPRGPVPGLFALAMGKHGAGELNYSSDIDISFFHEPERVESALAPGVEAQPFVDRLAQGVAALLSERTGDGYVFRVDLRLRPDPSSTPPAVPAPAAMAYYESVGQNWERAAFIKARPVCGDLAAGEGFLAELAPFIWRRSLDYHAIADIHSIKRQIHAFKTGDGLHAAGANLKLGRGGIREIEFFVQTQQLILGGRDPSLRAPRTLEALAALTGAGHVEETTRAELSAAYVRLRGLEHRIQMLADEQTHTLPEPAERRVAVAVLCGEADLAAFDAGVETLLQGVNRRYGELFSDEEDLSSPWGSLVFTGVENDPETLKTLERMGFSSPEGVAETIRSWHHGRVGATRTARGRELFTRLAPRLLTALAETGAPDAAFARFSTFFAGLSAGAQIQSLFLAQPELFALIVRVMAFAPRLARTLARYPAALDSMLDARFLEPLDRDTGVLDELMAEAVGESDFEEAMNAVRRIHRDQIFRIGIQTLTGRADADSAGHAYADLADVSIRALSVAALKEVTRQGGAFAGRIAVVALGKAGSREMTAGSDIDMMTVYEADDAAGMSEKKGWSADTFYSRFTQRLIAALSAHTAEGALYEVDMRLRPSGRAGPVSVSFRALDDYYAGEAETWEFLALTRARVAWSSEAAFGQRVAGAIEAALRRPRDPAQVTRDVRDMRALMDRERPGGGLWELKLAPGGQVDCEFAAQHSQLLAAARGEPLTVSTVEALGAPGLDPVFGQAWSLQQSVSQVIRCAFQGDPDPEAEPAEFRERLAEVAGFESFDALKTELAARRKAAREALEGMLGPLNPTVTES
ncbi:MAG: bifunctional [glutamine synthetase] adenylyltransferase/[glutamine synthetase]-adenylyl-L-tyrosine phosphorylase [Brevundimonas sp.]|uniref:bifunctional [glutamine synthetase] adenylyltransferase/[glutamine synthetase]-adenylyl-L-tyrosine phosphorylase n=1 Tax=Brevundimonas sp. TaxID=1871086 RepID=UPI00391D93D4